MSNSDLRIFEERIRSLETAIVELADFAMMTTLWLSLVTDEDTIALSKRWFVKKLTQILDSCRQSHEVHEHLLRFSRAFDELDAVPTNSPLHNQMWNSLIQRIRQETETNAN